MIQFDGKVILVTGAGRGLGRAYTMALAARGATVIAVDPGCDTLGQGQDPGVVEDVVDIAKDMGAEVIGHSADIRDTAAMGEVIDQTLSRFGAIHGLVCNAGVLIYEDDGFCTDAHQTMMEINHLAHVALIHRLWPHFKQQNYGRILTIAGLTGFYGEPGLAGYAAANGANLGMIRSLTEQAGEQDLRINALCPASYTRLSTSWLTQQQGQDLTADSVVPAMLWLMSDEAPRGISITAGGGHFAEANVREELGIWLEPDDRRPEVLAQNWRDSHRAAKAENYPSFRQRMARVMGIE